MRKTRFLFTTVLLICCLLGCKKESREIAQSNSKYELIFGTWSLQKQHVIMYVNNSKIADTLYTPTFDNRVEMKFNQNNSYANIKYYPTGNGNIGEGEILGSYGFAGSAFSMTNNAIVGLRNGDPTFADAMNTSGATVLSGYSIKVDELTSSDLVMQIVYTYSYNFGTQQFKVESDFYFNK